MSSSGPNLGLGALHPSLKGHPSTVGAQCVLVPADINRDDGTRSDPSVVLGRTALTVRQSAAMMQAQQQSPSSRHNGPQQIHPRFSSHSHPEPPSRNNSIDQADSDDGQSDDDNDGDELHDSVRNGKRKRPISVS